MIRNKSNLVADTENELIIYKESGKYYTREIMNIPKIIEFWDFEKYIKEKLNGRFEGMFLTSTYHNDVPFLLKL